MKRRRNSIVGDVASVSTLAGIGVLGLMIYAVYKGLTTQIAPGAQNYPAGSIPPGQGAYQPIPAPSGTAWGWQSLKDQACNSFGIFCTLQPQQVPADLEPYLLPFGESNS